MKKEYTIILNEDEIDLFNELFKVSSKQLHKKINKNPKLKNEKKVNLFYNVINKFYNAKREL